MSMNHIQGQPEQMGQFLSCPSVFRIGDSNARIQQEKTISILRQIRYKGLL